MNRIQRFEDLVAWQLAREVTKLVYTVTREGAFSRDFALVDQIRRAAVSVMSNIVEGFERESEPDRLRFYSMAKGSCAELRSQLYIALDAGYVSDTDFTMIRTKAEEVARVLGGLRSSISRSVRAATEQRVTRNGRP